MKAITLDQTESAPESYPTVEGLSDDAAALDAEPIWRRIEAYVSHRWTPRGVVWVVEGPGAWVPPIAPAVIASAAVWSGDAWGDSTPITPSPLGFTLDVGFWQISATVGDTTDALPGDVAEAYRRLAEYLSSRDKINVAGVSRYAQSIDGAISETISRNVNYVARALINSGAADLLRPYRSV